MSQKTCKLYRDEELVVLPIICTNCAETNVEMTVFVAVTYNEEFEESKVYSMHSDKFNKCFSLIEEPDEYLVAKGISIVDGLTLEMISLLYDQLFKQSDDGHDKLSEPVQT